jgi:hypothetical protein
MTDQRLLPEQKEKERPMERMEKKTGKRVEIPTFDRSKSLDDRSSSRESHEKRETKIDSAKRNVAQYFDEGETALKDQEPRPINHDTLPHSTERPMLKKAPKKLKKEKYRETLRDARAEMSVPERSFSRVVHNPVIEKTSEVAGSTIARPNALLFGSLASLILVAAAYLVAKYYGFTLSGFEWIGAYLLGWAIGLIVDWVRVALLNKRAGPA